MSFRCISTQHKSCTKSRLLCFSVGSILCAAATSSPMFIVGRAIAGLGGAGIFQGGLSIISQVVALQQRALYVSIVLIVFIVTSSIGPVLGCASTQKATWRWCFWMYVGLPFDCQTPCGSNTALIEIFQSVHLYLQASRFCSRSVLSTPKLRDSHSRRNSTVSTPSVVSSF